VFVKPHVTWSIRAAFILYLAFLVALFIGAISIPEPFSLPVWWALRIGAAALAFVHLKRLGIQGVGWAAAILIAPLVANYLSIALRPVSPILITGTFFILGNAPFIALLFLGLKKEPARSGKPEPCGPWVGVLFEEAKLDAESPVKAAMKLFFGMVEPRHLAGCIIHGGALPDGQLVCIAVHAAFREQAGLIEVYAMKSEAEALAQSRHPILKEADVPADALPFLGYVGADGVYTTHDPV
jgi:hypothetical protein